MKSKLCLVYSTKVLRNYSSTSKSFSVHTWLYFSLTSFSVDQSFPNGIIDVPQDICLLNHWEGHANSFILGSWEKDPTRLAFRQSWLSLIGLASGQWAQPSWGSSTLIPTSAACCKHVPFHHEKGICGCAEGIHVLCA